MIYFPIKLSDLILLRHPQKRKAQNRAAQRAFRERKERHLKDLETKVEDLEKASESANHENGRLRATVDKLQMELKEYRKRLSLNVSGASNSPPQSATQSRGSYGNGSNGGDFSFAFPKFGDLPGSFLTNGSIAKTTSPIQNGQRSASSSNSNIPSLPSQESSSSNKAVSPTSNNTAPSMPTNGTNFQAPTNGFSSTNFGDLSGLFSPSILENASRSNSTDYMSFPDSKAPSANGTLRNGSMTSNSARAQLNNFRQGSTASITNSPASTMSHALDSSCGTTPEPSADSPRNRQSSEGVLNTISEVPKGQSISEGKDQVYNEQP
jgi:AP-1-like transcription factor